MNSRAKDDSSDSVATGPVEGVRDSVADVTIPACYSKNVKVSGNELRQLISPQERVAVEEITAASALLRRATGEEVIVRTATENKRDLHLAPRRVLSGNLLEDGIENLEWINRPAPADPGNVLRSLEGKFVLVDGPSGSGDYSKGFRRPQLGAIHSVLGYWTTELKHPATVVMPTGTGKTETMLALLASERVLRLLVMVPSTALRTQIAEKFETLGILPEIGALRLGFEFPVVGRLGHAFASRTEAERFAKACNVVVTTPDALRSSSEDVQESLLAQFTHLFVDEAHHVPASSWDRVRAVFDNRPVVQFTATPYREDRRSIGGRLIYNFPLRLAKSQGYFSTINYRSVRSETSGIDEQIAQVAVAQLRDDVERGYDHVLMARVNLKVRAEEVLAHYMFHGAEFNPVSLNSDLTKTAQNEALRSIRSRETRIIICVDMLGEGFDLPALKIAAIHDPHKSLGITLQFIGRFARVKEGQVGPATVVVARPEGVYDETLRSLYREDADWDRIIEDLSEAATSEYETWTEFEKGFAEERTPIAAYDVEPKMSTVVYQTMGDSWHPERLVDVWGPDQFEVLPQVNSVEHVAWFVRRIENPVPWSREARLSDASFDLYVLFWDRDNNLLYVNCSNNEGEDRHHLGVAQIVIGDDVEIIKGESVFRMYHELDRLVPTNVGLLEARDQARKFTMFAGRNVEEGFPQSQQQTKTKTNVFAHGYRSGERMSLGVSTKGRIWEWRSGGNLQEWVEWCKGVGAKLTDASINIDDVMRDFIRPELLDRRPELVALAADWPWQVYASTTGHLRAVLQGQESPLVDTDIDVTSFNASGPIEIELRTEAWVARYAIEITANGMVASPQGSQRVEIRSSQNTWSFGEFVREKGITFLMEGDATIEPPGVLVRPNRELEPFNRDLIREDVSWTQTNIRKESRKRGEEPDSIQQRYLDNMLAGDWEVIVDDDGTGEIADLVGLRRSDRHLVVDLVHCKYSSEDDSGARLADLYDVCGQAQKSAGRRRDPELMLTHLLRRERNRKKAGQRTGIAHGSEATLEDIRDEARFLHPQFNVVIVQPGLSASRARQAHLELLAATEIYVREVGGATFEVVGTS